MSQTKNRWIALVFISMAISLVIIDGTIVNTIFPAVIKDLELSSTEVQWVQESYVLVFASLLLVWGSLADRYGRKLLLVVGIVIFVAASIWAGNTDSAQAMILARVVQGIGGAMVLPTTLSLVNAYLGCHHRWNGCGWTGSRWLVGYRLQLALGVLDQLATWRDHRCWTFVLPWRVQV
jgi:MFS family permease